MFWSIPNLMALERGILSSVLSKARNIDTGQLKWLKGSIRAKTHQVDLIQLCWVKSIPYIGISTQYGLHLLEPINMPNSLAWILDVLLLHLFLPIYGKQSLILLLIYLPVYFTSIFEENLRIDWFPYSLQAAFPFERLGMGAFRIALESVFNR